MPIDTNFVNFIFCFSDRLKLFFPDLYIIDAAVIFYKVASMNFASGAPTISIALDLKNKLPNLPKYFLSYILAFSIRMPSAFYISAF